MSPSKVQTMSLFSPVHTVEVGLMLSLHGGGLERISLRAAESFPVLAQSSCLWESFLQTEHAQPTVGCEPQARLHYQHRAQDIFKPFFIPSPSRDGRGMGLAWCCNLTPRRF